MKHVALYAAVVAGASLPLLGTTAASEAVPPPAAVLLRVGTYNIRTAFCDKGTPNAWTERRDDVLALIRKLDLDAFGLQEVMPSQARFLRDGLPEYGMVGDFRGASRKTGEASPVFYRKDRFTAGESGTFWLSETPDVPGSKSWDTACVRICTWVRLTDKTTGRTFCFANTHTDHRSELARTEGMKLIMRRMREFAPDGMPVVFTGDHNCGQDSESYRIASSVLKDSLMVTETPPAGPYRTYNGFKWRENPVPAVAALKRPLKKRYGLGDYIYVSDGIRVKSRACYDEPRPGMEMYPSDHFPVVAEIELPPEHVRSGRWRPLPRPEQLARMTDGPEIIGIIHWGLNTFTDKEWGYGDADPRLLNPAKFDADQIVGAAKAGGIGGNPHRWSGARLWRIRPSFVRAGRL